MMEPMPSGMSPKVRCFAFLAELEDGFHLGICVVLVVSFATDDEKSLMGNESREPIVGEVGVLEGALKELVTPSS